MYLDGSQLRDVADDLTGITDALVGADTQLLPSRALYNLVDAFDKVAGSSVRHNIAFNNSAFVVSMDLADLLNVEGRVEKFYDFVPGYLAAQNVTCALKFKP
ncbi:MAG: hypothetical protein H6867_06660 [Rhodospirillales bacterium]|nr:hypothetical protein [Rhodospirillales bacterium]MCB9995230.1 hypothetical protein [Rhodospirillales bacterium]